MAEKYVPNYRSDGPVLKLGPDGKCRRGSLVLVKDPSGGPFLVYEEMANAYLERLKHPEIQKRIKNGTWAKLPYIGKGWILDGLYPLPLEARERLKEISEEAAKKYKAMSEAEEAESAAQKAEKVKETKEAKKTKKNKKTKD
jgi:hypothetical protein